MSEQVLAHIDGMRIAPPKRATKIPMMARTKLARSTSRNRLLWIYAYSLERHSELAYWD
jgi:hypothetical protein